jgi:hypothetical protein
VVPKGCGSEWNVTMSRQIKKMRSIPGENALDAGFNTREEIPHSLREILDKKLELKFLVVFQNCENRVGFLCIAESLVYQLDPQNHEQFTELQNKCTHLAHRYSKDLNGLELYQDYNDVIISLKRSKQ